MRRLSKIWSLPRNEKQLLFESFYFLLLSHLSVKTIAFKRIYRFLHAHWNEPCQCPLVRADDIRLVNLSLSRAASRLPFKCLCLSRSIAAFVMLRRRGIPAVICAGAKFQGSSLLAHAWVHSSHGEIDQESESVGFSALMHIGQRSL
jgi:hypothetical protein